MELCKDYIWVYEYSSEILEVIKESRNYRDMVVLLKESFHLSDYQVKKRIEFRFDMLTVQEYESYKDEALRIEEKGITDYMENSGEFNDYAKAMEKRFGFS